MFHGGPKPRYKYACLYRHTPGNIHPGRYPYKHQNAETDSFSNHCTHSHMGPKPADFHAVRPAADIG